jgi:hypothetical protein
VFEGLGERRLEAIQENTLVIVASRKRMLTSQQVLEKNLQFIVIRIDMMTDKGIQN